MIYLYWSFPTTALTFKWSLMISTVARAPTHHVSFTSFAHRVLTVTTLWIVIEVIPDLEVPALIAESAALRWVVLPQIPPHRLNCHLYECMVKSNAMRALCRLALTCSEYARRAPGKTTLYPGVWRPKDFQSSVLHVHTSFYEFSKLICAVAP